MENAEVLEMTVKKVEDILKNRSQGQISVQLLDLMVLTERVEPEMAVK